MARRTDSEPLAADHDSFLDIVANIVGILIILVMVVTVRAKDAPLPTAEIAAPAPVDLDEPKARVVTAESDLLHMANEANTITHTLASREQERQAIAMMVTEAEKKVAEQRSNLDEQHRDFFDLKTKLNDARATLEKLELDRVHAAGQQTQVVEVENLPTPISKTVLGEEFHFQLRGGLLAYIPLDDLIEEAVGQARQKRWKLEGLPEVTEVIGPREGFRLRYTLEKLDLPLAMRLEGRSGYIIRAKRWELIPTDRQLGDPVEKALTGNSRLRQVLRRLNAKDDTITVWTYPDSFDDFRRLKKTLYEQGFAVAARPLPDGVPIAGSPSGSRSTAQ